MNGGAIVKKRFTPFLEWVFSARVSTVLLHALTVIWIVYRINMATFFNAYVLSFPFNVGIVLMRLLVVVVAFSELAKIFRCEYDATDAVAILLLLLMTYGFWGRDHYVLLYDAILVFAMRNERFRTVSWICVCTLSLCVLIVVASSQVGVIPDFVSPGQRARHYLGFTYCLVAPQLFFVVTVTLCWLRDRMITWIEIAVLAVINIALFAFTDSRLSFGLSLLALVVSIARKITVSDGAWRKIAATAKWSFIVAFAVSIVIVVITGYQISVGAHWLDSANTLSGNRIYLTFNTLKKFGIELFGQQVPWIGNGLDAYGNNDPTGYNYVDNLFFHALIDQGLVYTVLFVALFTVVTFKAAREKDYMLAIMLAVVAAHFIIDDTMLGLESNTMMFALGAYLVGPKNENAKLQGMHAGNASARAGAE